MKRQLTEPYPIIKTLICIAIWAWFNNCTCPRPWASEQRQCRASLNSYSFMFIIVVIIPEQTAKKVIDIFSCHEGPISWFGIESILSRKFSPYKLKLSADSFFISWWNGCSYTVKTSFLTARGNVRHVLRSQQEVKVIRLWHAVSEEGRFSGVAI